MIEIEINSCTRCGSKDLDREEPVDGYVGFDDYCNSCGQIQGLPVETPHA